MKEKKTQEHKTAVRPPIVTIMGHVDHGKTSLLDQIRRSNVAAKEAGGITQHTSAYQVEVQGRKITFIDTPGHAAFSQMRSRGAAVNDITVLVVAADDGVMPQTKESITHIKSAGTAMIVAINKMDTPGANVERVKKGLAAEDVLVEGYGGDVVAVPVSAKTGDGIKELLEMILLVADMAQIQGTSSEALEAVVIDSSIDRFKGPVALILIKKGILKLGETISAGEATGKIKAILSTTGEKLTEALPSMPVEILGLNSVPAVGEMVRSGIGEIVEKEKAASRDIFNEAAGKEIRLILKADTAGSLEAIAAAIENFETSDGKVKILHRESGEVNESDVLLAAASKSLIIAFNVNVPKQLDKLAVEEKVLIRQYKLIYELLDELKEGVDALLNVKKEEVLGKAEIVANFKAGEEKVAGCKVLEGKITKNDKVNILRDERKIASASIKSLKHLQEDINSASVGEELGMILDGKVGFAIGDIIEAVQ